MKYFIVGTKGEYVVKLRAQENAMTLGRNSQVVLAKPQPGQGPGRTESTPTPTELVILECFIARTSEPLVEG